MSTTLFAALEVAHGKVADACYRHHRGVEFLKFLKVVAKAYPRRQLHVVVDNYSAHNHADWEGLAGEASAYRLALHPGPLVVNERGRLVLRHDHRQATRRGSFISVRQVTDGIRTFIDSWSDRCVPFVWTKTADEILDTANRKADTETDY